MNPLLTFLLSRLDEDEKAIKDRDMQFPIHFVGCWYYNNNLDAYSKCDCDEDGRASKRALVDIAAKRALISSFNGNDQEYIISLLAGVYVDHPEYSPHLA